MRRATALVIVLTAPLARAHRFDKSFADLKATQTGASLVLDVDPDDFDETLASRFDSDRSGLVEPAELELHAGAIGAVVSAGARLARGGESCRPTVAGHRVASTAGMMRIHLLYNCPSQGELRFELALFDRLRPGHAHFLVVRLGETMKSEVLTHARPYWDESPGGLFRFLLLGIEHILRGYDHLLFLLALLLVATRLQQLLAIVTAFTVAHSITLAAAALGAVDLPARIVEPAIAATIVYVGLENYCVRQPRQRWLLTFALGLVHGFGFAGLLTEAGLPTTGRVWALLLFNLGVEAGQAAVVVLAAPLLVVLRRQPWYERILVRGGSGVVVLLGLAWLVSRIFGND